MCFGEQAMGCLKADSWWCAATATLSQASFDTNERHSPQLQLQSKSTLEQ